MRNYFRNIGTALTELLGAFTGITLNSNETTSGAAFRRQITWLRKTIDRMFFWQESHCKQAVQSEIEDCKELLLEYGFALTPPPVEIEEATVVAKTPYLEKLMKSQAPAREQEATDDDPMSDDFDAEAYVAGLPDEAKKRIVEWGVSIKMSRANRIRVGQLVDNWNLRDVKPRDGHGMVK